MVENRAPSGAKSSLWIELTLPLGCRLEFQERPAFGRSNAILPNCA